MSDLKWVVYGLVDPRTFDIRYIGCTGNFEARLRTHRARRLWVTEPAQHCAWKDELARAKLKVDVVVLARHSTRETALASETEWIARGLSMSWPLLNRLIHRKAS